MHPMRDTESSRDPATKYSNRKREAFIRLLRRKSNLRLVRAVASSLLSKTLGKQRYSEQ